MTIQPVKGAIARADIARTDPVIMISGIVEDGSLYRLEKFDAHIRGLHHRAV